MVFMVKITLGLGIFPKGFLRGPFSRWLRSVFRGGYYSGILFLRSYPCTTSKQSLSYIPTEG